MTALLSVLFYLVPTLAAQIDRFISSYIPIPWAYLVDMTFEKSILIGVAYLFGSIIGSIILLLIGRLPLIGVVFSPIALALLSMIPIVSFQIFIYQFFELDFSQMWSVFILVYSVVFIVILVNSLSHKPVPKDESL